MDALGGEDMGADRLDQRHQRRRRRADPVGQRRDVEIDAFPGIDCALTVERQMQAVLGEQDMGEQLRSRTSARDRVRWSGRLADRFAGPAGELLAHVLDHFPLPRNELQRLGHILADLAQVGAAATRAEPRAPDRRSVPAADARATDDEPAGAWNDAHDTVFSRADRKLGHGLCLRRVSSTSASSQLELVDERMTFRRLTVSFVSQLGDRELELLDQKRPVLCD